MTEKAGILVRKLRKSASEVHLQRYLVEHEGVWQCARMLKQLMLLWCLARLLG